MSGLTIKLEPGINGKREGNTPERLNAWVFAEIVSKIRSQFLAEADGERKRIVYVHDGERLRCGNCGKVCGEEVIGYARLRCRGHLCQTVNYFVSFQEPFPSI